MEYRTGQEMAAIAEIHPEVVQKIRLSRAERLMRWAELLQANPNRDLRTLIGTEFEPKDRRAQMRTDRSPLSVAFDDDVLRAEGLRDDSYGEGIRFFELSDRQLHRILCHCHFGPTVRAEVVGWRVAAIAKRSDLNLLQRIRLSVAQAFGG